MEPSQISSQNNSLSTIPNPPLIVWLTLFAMLAFTALVAHQINKDVNTAAQAAFLRHVDKTQESLQLRMHAYEQVLRGGVGFFSASERISRKDWQIYVASLGLDENFPGIQGIGFSKHLRRADLERHIRQIRSEGFADYRVTPDGSRPEYTAIMYLEPFNARNRRAFGFDMFSEPSRHAAMVQARDTGKASISGNVVLKQETENDVQSGFLMYLPLYQKGGNPETLQQRQNALLGYVYSPFRMNDLMRGILGEEDLTPEIDLEIYDGAEVSEKTLMYDDDRIMHGKNEKKRRLFNTIRPMLVADHMWTLAITSTPSFEARIDSAKPMIIGLSGIVISFLFFVVAWSLATNRARAQTLASNMIAALNLQEGLTQAIVDKAADGIITINESGEILSFNNTAKRIFGYDSEEVLGKNINILMPEPYHSAHDAYLMNYLTSGQQKTIGTGREVSGMRKNGEVFPMDLAVSEVKQTGKIRMFAGIVRDISGRKQAEEKLRHSEERFDLAIRGANDGLWDWDMRSNISYHSPRWNAMLGYPEVETSGPSGDWLKLIHPDDMAYVTSEVNKYIDECQPYYRTEYRMRHKDGHYVWILSRGIAQRDEFGIPYRMVGIYSDISKQKQMDSMKSEFVSTVSHELRTPLTSIRGSLGLVVGGVSGALPEQAKGLIDIAYKNTVRLLSLINDILDIDKIQSGKMDFNSKPQALMPLIEQVLAGNDGYAEQYQVKFNLLSALPDAMVNADGDRFMQVMSNLLSNAAKFSHAGGTVDIAVTRQKKYVRIAVIDHGVGISAAFHDRIFDKFTQADSSDTRHKGGTGLGLNISKAIIEMMQGEMGFESAAGVGTTFYCLLPEWRESL
jgi:PAS domain S-box-containing protein